MSDEVLYACTRIEKTAALYDPEHGCSLNYNTILCEREHAQAPTLKKLIEQLAKAHFVSMDDIWIPQDDEGVSMIGFNQLETVDGEVPNEQEREQWEKGELHLYLCDYSFLVEKRVVGTISVEDFKKEGIKYHD